MSFFPEPTEIGDKFACDAIELMVIPSAKDIGGFEVRRALPTAKRRLVGPFIFFDRMGPGAAEGRAGARRRAAPSISGSPPSPIFSTARSGTAIPSAPRW